MEQKNIYGTVRTFDRAKAEETRTIPFTASTSAEDRHETVLNQSNWSLKNFNNNPIIGYQHNVYGNDGCNAPDPDDVIGKGIAMVMSDNRDNSGGKQLDIDITFEPKELNPKADKVFQKLLFGSLNTVSVGFMPTGEGQYGTVDAQGKSINKETYYYEGQELLEVSVVNIPSNPEALTKSLRDSTHNGIMLIKRHFGNKLSFSDIESLTVGQVIKALDSGETPVVKKVEEPKKEVSETETKSENLLDVRRKRLDLIELEIKT